MMTEKEIEVSMERNTNNKKKNSFFKLDLLILSVLNQRDCYGYEITSSVRKETDDMFIIKEGVMYPILYRLLQEGLISSQEKLVNGRIRIYYHMEPDGLEYYDRMVREFEWGVSLVRRLIYTPEESSQPVSGQSVSLTMSE